MACKGYPHHSPRNTIVGLTASAFFAGIYVAARASISIVKDDASQDQGIVGGRLVHEE
jgi:hypothetical protein